MVLLLSLIFSKNFFAVLFSAKVNYSINSASSEFTDGIFRFTNGSPSEEYQACRL